MANFPVLCVIEVGTFSSCVALIAALKERDAFPEDYQTYCEEVIGQLALSTERCKLTIVNPSVAELGFTEKTYDFQVRERALELGLQICPQETAVQIFLQHPHKPKRGSIIIPEMEPLYCERHRNPSRLRIGTMNGKSERRLMPIYYGHPMGGYHPGRRIAFVLPDN